MYNSRVKSLLHSSLVKNKIENTYNKEYISQTVCSVYSLTFKIESQLQNPILSTYTR